MQYSIPFILALILLLGCSDDSRQKADEVVQNAIKAHGGGRLNGAKVTFDFRDRSYSVVRTNDRYQYTRTLIQEGDTIQDILENSQMFTRFVNGQEVDVADSMQTKYSNSVNSVLYFMQLPYLLTDPAVNKKYLGTTRIKGESYHAVMVTFDAAQGGTDHEDEYLYWFNTNTHKLDYLAYNYLTDGGGVRFREAYNRTERDGIVFQDYINYAAPVGTPLQKLPALFEADKLNELSRIVNEDVRVKRL